MYAVIETGGKQYRVEPGDVLDVELLAVPETKNPKIEFERVLMVGGGKETVVGSPIVAGAKVVAVPVEETRGPKVLVFKKKRRKGYRRLNGHRQDLLRVRIEDIKA